VRIVSRYKNARHISTPRAFVGDQTRFIEQRRNAYDLDHLRCLALGARQWKIGTLGSLI
jgi:hypothetical protein